MLAAACRLFLATSVLLPQLSATVGATPFGDDDTTASGDQGNKALKADHQRREKSRVMVAAAAAEASKKEGRAKNDSCERGGEKSGEEREQKKDATDNKSGNLELAAATTTRKKGVEEKDGATKRLEARLSKLKLETDWIDANRKFNEAKRALAQCPTKMETRETISRIKSTADELNNEILLLVNDFAIKHAKLVNAVREAELDVKIIREEQGNALARVKAELAQLELDINLFNKKRQLGKIVMAAMPYATQPIDNNTLYITDRRVLLNGPLQSEAHAHQIARQIYFFNNKNPELPIFLVIQDCTAGSHADAELITKAIDSCQAPVYVVLKGVAAGGAARIVTLAEHSCCFPSSVMVHEAMKLVQIENILSVPENGGTGKFVRRFMERVAKKLGFTVDQFLQEIKAHSECGRWGELGDDARKRMWVGRVVERMVELSARDIRSEEERAVGSKVEEPKAEVPSSNENSS